MKKKILAIALSAAMLLFCAGCAGGATPPAGDGSGGTTGQQQGSSGGSTGGSTGGTTGGTTGGVSGGSTGGTTVVDVTNETYGSFWMRCHDYKTMPICVYNPITNALFDKVSLYQDYKEAGINTLVGGWEGVSTVALNHCADYGLAYLVRPYGVDVIEDKELTATALAEAKYHSAFAGIMLSDEPGRVNFETLADMEPYLDGLMPELTRDALWWINLFPMYATKEQLWFRTYDSGNVPAVPTETGEYSFEEYVNDFMEICKPKVLSYDFYPHHMKVALRGTPREDYFKTMSIIRSAALKANVPFWTFIQNCRFAADNFVPDRAETLWSVNTSLTYGAKGMSYFVGLDLGRGYEGSMFDGEGNRRDEVFDIVKEANTQVAAVDEVLMCSKSEGIIIAGSTPWSATAEHNCYIPESDLLETYKELTAVTAGHALVGCFDYNGKTAFYITNNSVREGETPDVVTLKFNASVGGYSVIKAEKTQFTGNTLQLQLEAGEGALVVIE